MPNTPLQSAVILAGGQSALARKIGKSQAHIWWWLNRAKRVPAESVGAIEAATGISRAALRPDLFGQESVIQHPEANQS